MSFIITPDQTPEFYFQERCHIAELLNTVDCPGLSIARARVEPGVTTVLHLVRGAEEMYYLLSGQGDVEIAGKVIGTMRPGDLLILDEIGFRALNPQALDDFFEIIRHRYENKSTIFTSNRNFEDWGAILGDKVMASAIIDRIVHHAHILKFSGESYRIKDFLTHLNNIH